LDLTGQLTCHVQYNRRHKNQKAELMQEHIDLAELLGETVGFSGGYEEL